MLSWLSRQVTRVLWPRHGRLATATQAQPSDWWPANWNNWLARTSHFHRLSSDHQQRLGVIVGVLLKRLTFEGCQGLVLTDEHRVKIAAHVARMSLGWSELPWRSQTVLVYPAEFVTRRQEMDPAGVISEGSQVQVGEAWLSGPIVLSWSEVLTAGQSPPGSATHNVVLHEFAHRLDGLDGELNGVPGLSSPQRRAEFQRLLQADWQQWLRAMRYSRQSVIDLYGAESLIEYFAVCTETFFGSPLHLKTERPGLYQLLQGVYEQDPALLEQNDVAHPLG